VKTLGAYFLILVASILVLISVLGSADLLYFMIFSELNSYDFGFIIGRVLVFSILAALGYKTLKISRRLRG